MDQRQMRRMTADQRRMAARRERLIQLYRILIVTTFIVIVAITFGIVKFVQYRKNLAAELRAQQEMEESTENSEEGSTEGGTEVSGDTTAAPKVEAQISTISWDDSWKFADRSSNHSADAQLYTCGDSWNGYIIAVDAGNAQVLAGIVTNELLYRNFNVLLLRGTSADQMDHTAAVVYANSIANGMISLNYSSESVSGFYFMSIPQNDMYRSMEPVASHWMEHMALGDAILTGVAGNGAPIMNTGMVDLDISEISYAEIPEVNLVVGGATTDRSEQTLNRMAIGIVNGITSYFSVSSTDN